MCLKQAFTGPIARGLSLIAIVVGGLMIAFGEGGSKRTLAGIVFGLGMAMGAANFPGLVVLMRGAKTWLGYPALSRPLTIMGGRAPMVPSERHLWGLPCGTPSTPLSPGE